MICFSNGRMRLDLVVPYSWVKRTTTIESRPWMYAQSGFIARNSESSVTIFFCTSSSLISGWKFTHLLTSLWICFSSLVSIR